MIDALKIVFGASPSRTLRAPGAVLREATIFAPAPSALAALGSIFTALRYCFAVFETAASSNSATPSW